MALVLVDPGIQIRRPDDGVIVGLAATQGVKCQLLSGGDPVS